MELSKINCSKLRATALVQAIILSRYLFNIGFDFLNDQYSRYCSTQLKNTSKSRSVSSANHWLLLKFRMCSQPTSVNLLKCIVVHRVNCMNNCLRGAKIERTEKLVERIQQWHFKYSQRHGSIRRRSGFQTTTRSLYKILSRQPPQRCAWANVRGRKAREYEEVQRSCLWYNRVWCWKRCRTPLWHRQQ